jgi:integrase
VEVAEIITEVEGRLGGGLPKTRAGRRTVGLPRRVVAELEQHLAAYTAPGVDAPVFTAPAGGPLRATGFRGRIWRPATIAADLPGLKVHEFRHTAVALWIAAGASPKEVAARAGHTSVSFTLDRYGGLFEGHDRELRDRLDAMFTDAHEGQVLGLDRGASGPKWSRTAVERRSSRTGDALTCCYGEWR